MIDREMVVILTGAGEEKIDCPDGVDLSFHELRDRRSGKPIAWADHNYRWHAIGSGQIYSSVTIVAAGN